MNFNKTANILVSLYLIIISIYLLYMGFVNDPKIARKEAILKKIEEDSSIKVSNKNRSIKYRIAHQYINGEFYLLTKYKNGYCARIYINDTTITGVLIDSFIIKKQSDLKFPILTGFGVDLSETYRVHFQNESKRKYFINYNDFKLLNHDSNIRVFYINDSKKTY